MCRWEIGFQHLQLSMAIEKRTKKKIQVHIAYGSLQVEDKENIKILLGRKGIDLYKKYFGEVEEG